MTGKRAKSPTPGRQKPVSRKLFWVSMALVTLCSAIIVWWVIGNVNTAQFGDWPFAQWPRVLIVVLLAIFLTASLATTEIIPWTSLSFAEWRRPKVLGTLIYLALGGLSFAQGLSGIFNPPAAEQATLLEVRGDTTRIAEAVGVGQESLIRRKIAGLWGRPGCMVTYRFSLADGSLKVKSVRSPPSTQPYDPEYTVQADRDLIASGGERNSLIEANETVGFWPGFGVQFRYSTNGSTERLVWDHKKIATMPLELVRCPEV